MPSNDNIDHLANACLLHEQCCHCPINSESGFHPHVHLVWGSDVAIVQLGSMVCVAVPSKAGEMFVYD